MNFFSLFATGSIFKGPKLGQEGIITYEHAFLSSNTKAPK